MITIHSVSVYPRQVAVSGVVKIAVRVSDLSWDTLCTTYSTWERIAKSYPTWQAVKEGNAAQTSWQTIYAQTDWEAVRQGYYDWFNVKDNVK